MTARRLMCWTAGLALTAAALTGVALATPGSGATGVIMARAGFADPVSFLLRISDAHHNATNAIQVRDSMDTVVQQISFVPGGHTGWHSHPGPALVLVAQGELTLFSGDDRMCTGRTYSAGQAFIDPGQGHVHFGRSSPIQNTVLWVTYFDVPPGSGVRTDMAAPGNCPF